MQDKIAGAALNYGPERPVFSTESSRTTVRVAETTACYPQVCYNPIIPQHKKGRFHHETEHKSFQPAAGKS